MTAGILQHSQSGNVQVNYGDRVDGHYEVSAEMAHVSVHLHMLDSLC